jgi:predicted amidophosphoribosyltransferase
MALYTCPVCGMSIGQMTCGKCGKPLVHDTIKTPEGETVHVSKCPDGHGMVKSPMCCGQDMTCTS